MIFKNLFLAILMALSIGSKAQFIDIAESVPFGCPSVCAGGTIVLKIFNIQNLPFGAPVQAVLSSPTGSFASGITYINSNRFSTVSATGPWTNGAYTFSGNLTNLYFELTVPSNAVPSNTYNIRFRSAVAPFTQGNTLNLPGGTCSGLSITPSYTPLAAVAQTAIGSGAWIAHAYTWTSTTGAALTTPALIQQQTFFGSNNYKGHFLKNTLNFDLNFTGATGNGKMPGPVGTMNDGTSFQCGDGYTNNYSIRFYRNENFTPGFYRFTLGADDGARLSIDSGQTWIIDLFTEHAYASQSTDAAFPNGICLSGSKQLVIEYFQRPVDARVTFSATLLSAGVTQPLNQNICEGNAASFTVGSAIPSAQYQWQISTDGGQTYNAIQNSAQYSGVNSPTLQLNNTPATLNNALYNCAISGICGNPFSSDAATLTVNPIVSISSQPASQNVCVGDTLSFSVSSPGASTYQWFENTGSGFVAISNTNIYSGVNTSTLTINGANLGLTNFQYYCVVSGCGPSVTSDVATLNFTKPTIIAQPLDQEICGEKSFKLTVNANNASSFQWQLSTDAGLIFVDLVDNTVYQNTASSELGVLNANQNFDGFLYRCVINGCGQNTFSDTAQISIKATATEDFVPNIFTPNNDGMNDFFELNSAGLINISGTIYNRWGQEVYKWTSENAKWDGKVKGTSTNDGVYYYIISATSACDGTRFEKNGTLTLVK